MENRSIAIGWRAALVLAFFAFVGGVLCIFFPDFIIKAKFSGYTGRAWGSFAETSEDLANLYRIDLGEAGIMWFSIATLMAGVALNGFRQGERWAWFTFLLAGAFACASPIYVGITTGCWVCWMMGGISLVPWATAILVPARAILAPR